MKNPKLIIPIVISLGFFSCQKKTDLSTLEISPYDRHMELRRISTQEANSKMVWTASYSVNFYNAHHPSNYTGVISPTAAISSIAYTPKESMEVIKNLNLTMVKKSWANMVSTSP